MYQAVPLADHRSVSVKQVDHVHSSLISFLPSAGELSVHQNSKSLVGDSLLPSVPDLTIKLSFLSFSPDTSC